MHPVKPSQRHYRNAQLIGTFRNAYVDLVNASSPTTRTDSMYSKVLGPAHGVSPADWNEKRSEVARAAGAAASAYHQYGGKFTLRNAVYITNNVDPIANWDMSVKDPEQFPPDTVLVAVESAAARARQEAEDAAQRECGLTGVIAAFIRWPSDLREAVGPGHSVERTAAGVIGVIGQLFVATVGGALAVGLAAGAVALWKLAF